MSHTSSIDLFNVLFIIPNQELITRFYRLYGEVIDIPSMLERRKILFRLVLCKSHVFQPTSVTIVMSINIICGLSTLDLKRKDKREREEVRLPPTCSCYHSFLPLDPPLLSLILYMVQTSLHCQHECLHKLPSFLVMNCYQ